MVFRCKTKVFSKLDQDKLGLTNSSINCTHFVEVGKILEIFVVSVHSKETTKGRDYALVQDLGIKFWCKLMALKWGCSQT